MNKTIAIAGMSIAALLSTAPTGNTATVLTLEGGFVGIQHIFHFTPHQLRGQLCEAPNHCQPVDYFAFPGTANNEKGATDVEQAIDALPDGEQTILFGHSQGGQVIYTALRRWADAPESAPDPARLSWVSIGNPENQYGGISPTTGSGGAGTNLWPPDDTPYQGMEVIRQYDGWADWPDDTSNFLAVVNAVIGMQTVHTAYWDVNIDAPTNIRLTPDLPGGAPGNVTYVWVPTDVLPLVAWAGPLAPMLDNLLRPTVEAAYHRPVDIPDPTPPEAAAVTPARSTGAAKRFAPTASTPHHAARSSTETGESGAEARGRHRTARAHDSTP